MQQQEQHNLYDTIEKICIGFFVITVAILFATLIEANGTIKPSVVISILLVMLSALILVIHTAKFIPDTAEEMEEEL
jgi:hypothetical protein